LFADGNLFDDRRYKNGVLSDDKTPFCFVFIFVKT